MIGVIMTDIRPTALNLLKYVYRLTEVGHREEIAHLELRIIRDDQAPRFEALKESHPEISQDFEKARGGCHETLLRNRVERERILREIFVPTLRAMIESEG